MGRVGLVCGAAAVTTLGGTRTRSPLIRAFMGFSRILMLGDMTIQRMDNVAIVVDDLDATVAFFTELDMELGGKGQIEGL